MGPDNFQHRASLDKAKHRDQKASARCLGVATEHPPHSASHKVTRPPILLLCSLLQALVLGLAWGCVGLAVRPVVGWRGRWVRGGGVGHGLVLQMRCHSPAACHRVLVATRTTVTT